jgi:hypothetical protein
MERIFEKPESSTEERTSIELLAESSDWTTVLMELKEEEKKI